MLTELIFRTFHRDISPESLHRLLCGRLHEDFLLSFVRQSGADWREHLLHLTWLIILGEPVHKIRRELFRVQGHHVSPFLNFIRTGCELDKVLVLGREILVNCTGFEMVGPVISIDVQYALREIGKRFDRARRQGKT